MTNREPSDERSLLRDTRGALVVEYIVVASVAIGVALALAALGPGVVRGYAAQQNLLYQSNP
ncbi:MAG: hypothetical protein QM756_36780 [Polyangiaceae bacterium]